MALDTLASRGQVSEESDTGDPPIQIVLHPAGEPRPALKYRLLPPFLDRRPGNAAVNYLKVPHEHTALYSDGEFWTTICKWIEMPLPELRDEKEEDGGERAWITGSSNVVSQK